MGGTHASGAPGGESHGGQAPGASGSESHGHQAPGAARSESHGGHASVKTYVLIGVILTIITAIEVAIFYIPALAGVLVPVLLTLSAAKFVIVVLFYMHLKFDNPIFGRVFFGPMFLAMLVVIGMVLLFKYLPTFYQYGTP